VPFRVPAGIKLIRVDARTGMRAGPGDTGKIILEAFKPGTGPPDNYSVVGATDPSQPPPPGYPGQEQPGYISASPDADRAVRRGNGLY
jgi:penicillin-binding protein 1A